MPSYPTPDRVEGETSDQTAARRAQIPAAQAALATISDRTAQFGADRVAGIKRLQNEIPHALADALANGDGATAAELRAERSALEGTLRDLESAEARAAQLSYAAQATLAALVMPDVHAQLLEDEAAVEAVMASAQAAVASMPPKRADYLRWLGQLPDAMKADYPRISVRAPLTHAVRALETAHANAAG